MQLSTHPAYTGRKHWDEHLCKLLKSPGKKRRKGPYLVKEKDIYKRGLKIPALSLSVLFLFSVSHVLYKNSATKENLLDSSWSLGQGSRELTVNSTSFLPPSRWVREMI